MRWAAVVLLGAAVHVVAMRSVESCLGSFEMAEET